MLVLAIAIAIAVVATAVIAIAFAAIVVGIHQAHRTDLGQPGSTRLSGFTGRVLGLHVRRHEPVSGEP